MELKRILAKDSRTAMDIAMNRYGKDVLVVSSQSVGGQVELVVALDVAPAPAAASAVMDEGQPSAFTQAFRQALGPMPEAPRAAVPADGLPPVPAGLSSLDSGATPARFAAAGAGAPARRREPTLAPAVSAAPATPPRPVTPTRPAAPAMAPAPAASFAPAAPAADDARGREVVDLVRREIAALRKEFAMSRQVQAWQDGRHWPPALQPVMQALHEAAVPAGLRALLIDAAQDSDTPARAVAAMRGLMSDALSTPPAVKLERGVHAILGPSGAGKTHMITRLARAAASHAGAHQVAIIAFNDQRFGAWSHSRVLAAQAGVSCLRAPDATTLRMLLEELSGHALVFIDTAGADVMAQAQALRELDLGVHLHLLMPADASIGSVRLLLESAQGWRSLMVGKVDESSSPWALMQALSEGRSPVSYMCDSAQVQAPPRAFEARRLIAAAFDRLDAEVAAQLAAPADPTPAFAGSPAARRATASAGAGERA
jgi:flagellar biosynthesis protein FlhF